MNITLTEVNFTVETRFEEFTTPELGGVTDGFIERKWNALLDVIGMIGDKECILFPYLKSIL